MWRRRAGKPAAAYGLARVEAHRVRIRNRGGRICRVDADEVGDAARPTVSSAPGTLLVEREGRVDPEYVLIDVENILRQWVACEGDRDHAACRERDLEPVPVAGRVDGPAPRRPGTPLQCPDDRRCVDRIRP